MTSDPSSNPADSRRSQQSRSAPLRAVVIDDQPAIRQALIDLLDLEPDLQVVGSAQNGEEGLRVVFQTQPDVILLDLEMPRMDGFSFLRLLMSKRPTPVVVVSSNSTRESVFRALELGALEFVAKPTAPPAAAAPGALGDSRYDVTDIRDELLCKVRLARRLQVVTLVERTREHRERMASALHRDPDREARSAAVVDREARSAAVVDREARSAAVVDREREARSAAVIDRDRASAAVVDRERASAAVVDRERASAAVVDPVHGYDASLPSRRAAALSPDLSEPRRPPRDRLVSAPERLLCIGASTGGPAAILSLLLALDEALPVAVLVTQHMPENFTGAFAERLARATRWPVQEATEGALVRAGEVLVAAGRFSLRVASDGTGASPDALRVQPPLLTESRAHGFVPSVDRMLEAAAQAMGGAVIAVVLTGMSGEGVRGAQAVRAAGGVVLVEDPSSAVLAGMPEEVIRAGAADEVVPLARMADAIARVVYRRSLPSRL